MYYLEKDLIAKKIDPKYATIFKDLAIPSPLKTKQNCMLGGSKNIIYKVNNSNEVIDDKYFDYFTNNLSKKKSLNNKKYKTKKHKQKQNTSKKLK